MDPLISINDDGCTNVSIVSDDDFCVVGIIFGDNICDVSNVFTVSDEDVCVRVVIGSASSLMTSISC